MHSIFKKLAPLALGILAMTSPLIAQADTDMRMSKIESQMRDVGTTNARGTYGAKLADASPNIDGYGFYVTADAVLYRLFEDNNQYAIRTPDTLTATDHQVKSYTTNFGWDWGFKTGLGYYAEHDFWQSGFEFTYLQTQTSSKAASDPTRNALYLADALSEYNSSGNPFTNAYQSFAVSFYNLDWTLGKDFFVSKYLSFLPEVGVKATWFHQTTHNTWTESTTAVESRASKDYYTGVGPKADIAAKLYLGKNFSIVGGVDVALLFATNKVNYTQLTTDPTTGIQSEWYSSYQTKRHISPYLGLNLGLAYDTNFKDDSFNFGVKLAYEQQYYNKASRLLNQDAPSASDFSLQGVDLSFIFSF